MTTLSPSDIMQQEMARRIDALELSNTQLAQALVEVNRKLNGTTALPSFKFQKEVEIIRKVVASAFEVTVDELCSDRRPNNIAFARFCAFDQFRKRYNVTLNETARAFNRCDHGTVSRAMSRVLELMDVCSDFKRRYSIVEAELDVSLNAPAEGLIDARI